MYLWTRKKLIQFWKSSASESRSSHFSTIRLIFLENWLNLHENFTTNVPLDLEVPVKFWNSPWSESGSHPDSGYGLRIRTRFALVEVCARRVLMDPPFSKLYTVPFLTKSKYLRIYFKLLSPHKSYMQQHHTQQQSTHTLTMHANISSYRISGIHIVAFFIAINVPPHQWSK